MGRGLSKSAPRNSILLSAGRERLRIAAPFPFMDNRLLDAFFNLLGLLAVFGVLSLVAGAIWLAYKLLS
jgi:hypothetical protein